MSSSNVYLFWAIFLASWCQKKTYVIFGGGGKWPKVARLGRKKSEITGFR
jgi:hypothetical protein